MAELQTQTEGEVVDMVFCSHSDYFGCLIRRKDPVKKSNNANGIEHSFFIEIFDIYEELHALRKQDQSRATSRSPKKTCAKSQDMRAQFEAEKQAILDR